MINEGFTVWITSKPGLARNALAHALEDKLLERGLNVERLDADELCAEWLPALAGAREEQTSFERFLGYLCSLFNRNGVIAIGVGITPTLEWSREHRLAIDGFVQVFLDGSPQVRARENGSEDWGAKASALSSESSHREQVGAVVFLDSDTMSLGACCLHVIGTLERHGLIPTDEASDYGPEDEAKITQSLKDLGYL